MAPPQIPTSEQESQYVGLYTFIISTIAISGGSVPEGKLERYLKRMNANQSTPLGTTEELLKRMIKDGYIVKVKDSTAGEDMTDFLVGPRGKVEVPREAIANLVRTVYGPDAIEDLEERINRSLGIADEVAPQEASMVATPTPGEPRRAPGRPRRRRDNEDEDEDEDE